MRPKEVIFISACISGALAAYSKSHALAYAAVWTIQIAIWLDICSEIRRK